MKTLSARLERLEELIPPQPEQPEEEPELTPVTAAELISGLDTCTRFLRAGWVQMTHNPHAEQWLNIQSGRVGAFPFQLWGLWPACPWESWKEVCSAASWLERNVRKWYEWSDLSDRPNNLDELLAWVDARKKDIEAQL